MAKYIILGDVHLGEGASIGKIGIGTTLNSRFVDQIDLLNWVLQKAVDESVIKIVITGDVFDDPQPHPFLIKLFISWLNRCHDEGVAVDIIYGNHDIIRGGQFVSSALDIVSEANIPSVSLFNDIETHHGDGVCFTYLPFRDRRSFGHDTHDQSIQAITDKLVYEVASIPQSYKKIVVGHLALEGSIYVGGEVSDTSNELFCPLDMFNDYDFVWMGHIHTPQVMRREPHIAHVGSMDLSEFSDHDRERVIILIDTDTEEFYEEVAIPCRPLGKLVIAVEAGVEDVTKFVTEQIEKTPINLKNAIARVEVQLLDASLGSIDRKKVEELLVKLGVFHVANLSETKKISLIKKKTTGDTEITNLNDVNTAIKTWANAFLEKDEIDEFISLATEVIQEVKELNK